MPLIQVAQRNKEGEQKPTRYFSSRQEKSVAKTLGGKVVSNSGAGKFQKGDVLGDNILLECKTKTTPSKSMSIQKEWIEKNEKESLYMGKKYSAIAFNFGPDEPNYYIIDEFMFQQLLQVLSQDQED